MRKRKITPLLFETIRPLLDNLFRRSYVSWVPDDKEQIGKLKFFRDSLEETWEGDIVDLAIQTVRIESVLYVSQITIRPESITTKVRVRGTKIIRSQGSLIARPLPFDPGKKLLYLSLKEEKVKETDDEMILSLRIWQYPSKIRCQEKIRLQVHVPKGVALLLKRKIPPT